MAVHLQAETTVASRSDAERIAKEIVQRRLAACAQIVGPIRSIYRWEGEIQDDEEFLVLFKTRAARVDEFKEVLGELHPYDIPEILLFEVKDGSRAYLSWIDAETDATPG